MIKREDLEVVNEETRPEPADKIDALATALGFSFENGEYVKARKVRKIRRTKKQEGQPVFRLGTRRKLATLGSHVFRAVAALHVGEEYDITDAARAAHRPMESIIKSIGTFQWKQRVNFDARTTYVVRRENWRIIVRRAA